MNTLRILATRHRLVEIRNFVVEILIGWQLPQPFIDSLKLAVDEAATNVVVHGYHTHEGILEIEVRRDSVRVFVALRDEAPPFDPTTVPAPNLCGPLTCPGGFGIHLMRQAVDEVRYRALPDGGNELILVKLVDSKQ